jgi:hypothetical protein
MVQDASQHVYVGANVLGTLSFSVSTSVKTISFTNVHTNTDSVTEKSCKDDRTLSLQKYDECL